VLEAAVTEEAGDSFDVGTVIKDIDRKGMAGAVPGDMLFDASGFDPTVDRLEAHVIRRQLEDWGVEIFIFVRLTDEADDFVRKRDDHAGVGRVTLGFVLLELKQMVGEIDVLIGKILDIAEAEATIEAEDEGATDFGILLWVVIGDELLHLLLREHVFAQDLVIDLDGDASAGIFAYDIVLESVVDNLFETLEA
jgi:hypothetical protein